LLSLAAPLLLRGGQDVTFTTDVKVVNLLATVVDKRGHYIADLKQDDFALLEDGRPQTIRYFSRQTDLPLTIGLMVDTSTSQQRLLGAERGASLRFLDQVLREAKDHVFLMQFDMAILVRQPLTASRRQLDEALAFVDTPTMKELQRAGGGGTLLFDAVVKASNEIMRAQSGRKALILMTDGVDVGSEASVTDAIDAAQRADTLIYSILFADPGYYSGGGPDGRRPLQRMASETGGGFYEVTRKLGIEAIFDTVQQELRSQYNLGFVSDQPVEFSSFRKLRLSARDHSLVVHARDRYWAKR
jgi:VWFA-related protein